MIHVTGTQKGRQGQELVIKISKNWRYFEAKTTEYIIVN